MNFLAELNKYNIYLLIPIFMLCYFGLKKLSSRAKKNWYQAKYGERNRKYARHSRDISWLKEFHFIKAMDKKLIQQGNPLGLNGHVFYLIKILLFALCFVMGVRSYNSYFTAFIVGALGFFSLDLFIHVNGIIRNNSINNDLINAVDCLYLQMSASMTLGHALRGLHEVCENKDLKKEMIKLSSEYELSGHNIEKAAEEFKNAFNIIEIDLFASALKQQIFNGNSRDSLGNLSEILREGYIDRLNIRTKLKSFCIIIGVVIIMIDIIALTMFPIFVDAGEGMKKIFQ
ncbi:MAG: type II secretion system F family protein [Deltaproteobacteria bacterium]